MPGISRRKICGQKYAFTIMEYMYSPKSRKFVWLPITRSYRTKVQAYGVLGRMYEQQSIANL